MAEPVTAYARRLVGADLAAETKRARSLTAEASAERGQDPAGSEKLAAAARERLARISAEQAQRRALAGRLSDGTTGQQFAATLLFLPDAALGLQAHLFRTEAAFSGGRRATDARVKLLAVEREQARREATAEARGLERERTRLEEVRRQYGERLAALPAAQLAAENRMGNERLEAARNGVRRAREALAGAGSWGDRRRAEEALRDAERALRTEHARRAVLVAGMPVRLNRRVLHEFADSLKPLDARALAAEKRRAQAVYAQMTTGAIRGSREDLAMQRARMAIVDQAIGRRTRGNPPVQSPKPSPAAPGVVGPQKPGAGHQAAGAQVWKEPGVFVWHTGAFPADIAIQRLKAQGVKWVTVQIADGMTVNAETEQALAAGYIQKLHAAGIKVGFWGVNREAPEAEAKLAADLVKKWGADFYIANAEIEYKYTSADGSPSPENFGRSRRWVETFREEMPDTPAAISSYGRADMADLDWKVWRDAGFDWLPQAYLNEFDINDPALCVEGAVKAGWPRDRVHPTLGLWGGGQARVVPASEYVASLERSGSVGFSSYLAEQMSEEDWQGLGAGILRGGLAE